MEKMPGLRRSQIAATRLNKTIKATPKGGAKPKVTKRQSKGRRLASLCAVCGNDEEESGGFVAEDKYPARDTKNEQKCLAICLTCEKWVEDNMPGTNMYDLVDEKIRTRSSRRRSSRARPAQWTTMRRRPRTRSTLVRRSASWSLWSRKRGS